MALLSNNSNYAKLWKKVISIEKNIKIAFSKIREENNDHTDQLNLLTNEFHANVETFAKIEDTIEMLKNRIDDLTMEVMSLRKKLAHASPEEISNNKDNALTLTFNIEREELLACLKKSCADLSSKEKMILALLYTHEQGLSYDELANKLNIPVYLIPGYVSELLSKNIYILRSYKSPYPKCYLHPAIKELQAKFNVFMLNEYDKEVCYNA